MQPDPSDIPGAADLDRAGATPDSAAPSSRRLDESATPTADFQPPSIHDHELLKKIGGGSYGEVRITCRRPLTHSLTHSPGSYSPRTLRSELKRHVRLPVAECVRIGLSLTSALAHLHQQRLVHRDVKPSNIIFVGGVPKLADIGLVADFGEARSYVGTEGFIPPEGPGTPQADIYSIGKVLYEISTGKDRQDFPQLPPELLRENVASASSQVRETPQSQIANRKSQIPTSLIELNEVLLRACHKEVRRRYASAEAMLADLQLLQDGQSVQHKRVVERRFAFAKRFSFAVGVLGTLAGIGLWSFQSYRSAVLAEKPGTTNREALMAYQRGHALVNRMDKRTLNQAMAEFSTAIRLDPSYASAYAGLVECYL